MAIARPARLKPGLQTAARPSASYRSATTRNSKEPKKTKGPVVRLGYSASQKNSLGRPSLVGVCRAPDGAEVERPFPEEPVQQELAWFQAYVKDCRGWLNPQKLLPEWVGAKGAKR